VVQRRKSAGIDFFLHLISQYDRKLDFELIHNEPVIDKNIRYYVEIILSQY